MSLEVRSMLAEDIASNIGFEMSAESALDDVMELRTTLESCDRNSDISYKVYCVEWYQIMSLTDNVADPSYIEDKC